MRVVAKIGGAQLEAAGPRAALATAVASATAAGHDVVLVHGGGNQIRAWAKRLDLPQRYEQGLRITDAATAELVTAVLAGLVNKQLVAALEAAGVRAAGISGADGSTLQASVHAPAGRDLGFVGAVQQVDTRLLEHLLEARIVPVVATVAPLAPDAAGDRGQLYNVNADMAAGPMARALAADALLLLTDVPGVLDARRQLCRHLGPSACDALLQDSVLEGGMRPKVEAARAALGHGGPDLVAIAPAAGDDALRAALAGHTGTRFSPLDSPAGGPGRGERHG